MSDGQATTRQPVSRGAKFALGIIVALVVVGHFSGEDAAPGPAPTAAEAMESPEAAAARKAREADDRRKGFHCLSPWDGSIRDLVTQVKNGLRNPASFDHVDTTIKEVTPMGQHLTRMDFRAENGFGGLNLATAWAQVDHETCAAEVMSIKDDQ